MSLLTKIENTQLQPLPNVPDAFLAPVSMSKLQKLVTPPKKIKSDEEESSKYIVTNIFSHLVVDADGKVFEVQDGDTTRPISKYEDIVDNLTSTTISTIVTDILNVAAPGQDRLGK